MGLKVILGGHVPLLGFRSFAIHNGSRFGLRFGGHSDGWALFFAEEETGSEKNGVKLKDNMVVLNANCKAPTQHAVQLMLAEFGRVVETLGLDYEIEIKTVWDE